MSRVRTPRIDCTSAAAIALVALALGGCPPRPGPEPVEPPGNEPMTGGSNDGALVPGQSTTPNEPSPDPNEPSPDPNEPSAPPGPPTPAPPPGAVDPTRPQT
jgi:hypothetical protein